MQRVVKLGVTLGALFGELRDSPHAASIERVVEEYAKLVEWCIEHPTAKK